MAGCPRGGSAAAGTGGRLRSVLHGLASVHLPLAIGTRGRDQWMHRMVRAPEVPGVDVERRERRTAANFRAADFMRNREERRAAAVAPDRAWDRSVRPGIAASRRAGRRRW